MARELRIFRTSPFEPMAQELLVPPKAIEPPDLTDLTGPNAYFFLAERAGRPLGCIALRNEGSFGLVTGFHFKPEETHSSLPEILVEQIETQARSLRLPVLRVWVGDMHANVRAALVRCGFFPDGDADADAELKLFERPLNKRVQLPPNLTAKGR
ncbi:MAG: hypothetical protein QNJ03_06005 [Dinoroseobacter sp.]|nr:hypothetical protein [Dinoroseobacter sp.]